MNTEKFPPELAEKARECADRLRQLYPVPDLLRTYDTYFMLASNALDDEEDLADRNDILTILEYLLMADGQWAALAYLFEHDTEFDEDAKNALHRRIVQAAEQGNEHCIFFLGLLCGCEEDTLAYFSRAAELGQTEAMFRMGHYHRNMEMHEKAARYFRQAADAGHSEAALYFAYCCEKGDGIPQDTELALEYYAQAWEFPYANYRLGIAAEAECEFKKAAEHYGTFLTDLDSHDRTFCTDYETGDAWLRLGRCLLFLTGENRPYFGPTPMECFENVRSLYDELYESRETLFRMGRAYYLSEEELATDREAAFHMGRMYFFGIEVKADPDRGLGLLEDAAGLGSEEAETLLKEINSWDDVPCTASADEDARKQEALLRLSILERMGVDPWIREQFAENGTPGFASDDYAGFFPYDDAYFDTEEYPQIRQEIENLERRGLTVYFIHVSLTLSYGCLVSLFYVPESTVTWLTDRKDLLQGTPIAAVANLTEEYTEMGTVAFTITDGCMERRY